jgi:guanylate kinase
MTSASPRSSVLCVVSGPSGSGKTTLCRAVCAEEGCYHAVSATTRPARPGEVDGRDYHFFSDDEFHRRIDAGEFLEWANVYGRFYGTLKSEVVPHLESGGDVIMDLDTQGAATMRAIDDPLIKAAHFDVFLLPSSLEELRNRLSSRRSDLPEVQERRLAAALQEIARWPEYSYTLLSGSRDDDLARLRAILGAEKMRSRRLGAPPGF